MLRVDERADAAELLGLGEDVVDEVVFPEDSGPKISTIRPRGIPPMPSARSSDSAPVEIVFTLTSR